MGIFGLNKFFEILNPIIKFMCNFICKYRKDVKAHWRKWNPWPSSQSLPVYVYTLYTIPKIVIQVHWRKWYPTLTTMSMIVCYRPISYLYEDVSLGTLVWSVHEKRSIIIIISQRQPLTIQERDWTIKIGPKKRRRQRVNRVENATKKYSCKPRIESSLTLWKEEILLRKQPRI